VTDKPDQDPITPDPRLIGITTPELVNELLGRHEAVMIGIVAIDEETGGDKYKIMYEGSGSPDLQLCISRDLRFLAIGNAAEAGISFEEVQEIMNLGIDSPHPDEGWEQKFPQDQPPHDPDDAGEEWKRK
jgi:hypothetical protein